MNRSLTIVVSALAVLLIIILAVVLVLVIRDNSDGEATAAQASTPAAAPSASATVLQPTELPPPVLEVLPTVTPQPTSTPAPTETPAPTDTPAPTATNTPVPVVIRPTNTPVPPTNTPAPPAPDTRGLTATSFGLQSRSSFTKNGQIWFTFSLVNNAGSDVPFGALGVMPRKDGGDRRDWYQNSWGGNDDAIPTSGLSWEDNIRLPEAGNYTLRLVICFDTHNACISGGGAFVTLSQEISVTIN